MNRLVGALLVMVAAVAAPGPSAQDGAPGGRLEGRVLLGRRQPVVGASVVVRPAGQGGPVAVTTTGDRGTFGLDGLPDGEYVVRVYRDGLAPASKQGVELRFPFRPVVEFTMTEAPIAEHAIRPAAAPPPGRHPVRGTVRDAEGAPLGEVAVRIVRPDGAEDPRNARTDPAGAFAFDAVLGGGWLVEIAHVGYLAIRAPIEIEDPTRLDVRLVPRPAGYEPSPIELLPPERPTPPAGLR